MARFASLAVAVLLAAACSKSDPSPTGTAPPRDVASTGGPGGAPGGAKGGPTIGRAQAEGARGGDGAADTSFQITAEQPSPTAAGGEAVGRFRVHPGSGYKMNKEFPTKLTLEPPAGVTLAKAVFEIGDAEQFSEKELAFAIKMSAPAAGEYTIPGTLKFAVCTDTTCDPKKQKVALVLKAN